MTRIFSTGLLALVATCLTCLAAGDDLERAVLSFPEISAGEFRPDEAARSANALIKAGEARACAALLRVAVAEAEPMKNFDLNKKACLLGRLVFATKDATHPLRPPGLGATSLVVRSLRSEDWPFLPFAIVDDVPLSITEGYTLEGRAEGIETYLSYCTQQGVFRKVPFPVPSPTTASNALSRVLGSPVWKALKWNAPEPGVTWLSPLSDADAEALKAHAEDVLWSQIRNMANPPVQRTGADRSAERTNQASGAASPRR